MGLDVELLLDVDRGVHQFLRALKAQDAGHGRVGHQETALGRALEDALHRVLEQVGVAGLGRHLGLPGPGPLAPVAGLAQFALDGRDQPGPVALLDEVRGPGPQKLHGRLLADGPGDHDEGDVQPLGLEQFQGGQAVERGHVVVREHDVPRPGLQGGIHVRPCLHPGVADPELPPMELPQQQDGVVLVVLHHQDPDIQKLVAVLLAHSRLASGRMNWKQAPVSGCSPRPMLPPWRLATRRATARPVP